MMSGTIEALNNIILLKLKYLQELAEYIKTYQIHINPIFFIELETLGRDYKMGSIRILTNYFLLVNQQKKFLGKTNEDEDFIKKKFILITKKDKFYRDYQIFLTRENFIGKMDRLYTFFRNTLQLNLGKVAPKHFSRIKRISKKYNDSTITRELSTTNYTRCGDCATEMKIMQANSEIICTKCGKFEVLSGTVFEDVQFYYQEGQRTKHGSYDPSKHCKFWIERIQARESKTIPDMLIETIRDCIRINKVKNIEEITCEEIRKYLRHTKNTSFNEHVPLIRKIITGITPPQLTDREVQLIILIFGKAIKIYEDIKPNEKTNVMYHPYLIYKIIEHILRSPNMQKRRNAILACIHLQSRETLIENDIIWYKVCEILNIEYTPTDRNLDLTMR